MSSFGRGDRFVWCKHSVPGWINSCFDSIAIQRKPSNLGVGATLAVARGRGTKRFHYYRQPNGNNPLRRGAHCASEVAALTILLLSTRGQENNLCRRTKASFCQRRWHFALRNDGGFTRQTVTFMLNGIRYNLTSETIRKTRTLRNNRRSGLAMQAPTGLLTF